MRIHIRIQQKDLQKEIKLSASEEALAADESVWFTPGTGEGANTGQAPTSRGAPKVSDSE